MQETIIVSHLPENDIHLIIDDTPLLLACYAKNNSHEVGPSSRFQIAEILLKHSNHHLCSLFAYQYTDASLQIYQQGNNPLHWGCYHGDLELVEVNSSTLLLQ